MSELAQLIEKLDMKTVPGLVQQKLDAGEDPLAVLAECRDGMDLIGEGYKTGKYFLGELIVSGEIFKQAMRLIEPKLKERAGSGPAAKVVIGTVKGDIHNIGKDIVVTLLKAVGFEVHDLGIDVSPQAFVDKVKETGATILGLSGLLTPSFDEMKNTVDAVKAAGLRESTKVVIGGGVVTEQILRFTGADAFTTDAIDGVDICKRFAGAPR